MSRVTLKDVAREAGLSVTQVSRALNGHDDVAESTKEHARQVAARLDYVPNLAARRLQDPGLGTGSIGVFLPSETLRFSDPFFGDLLSSMVMAAGQAGYQLQLSTPASGDAGLVAPYDEAIRQSRVDGFVLLRTLVDDPRVDFLLERGIPFVAFGRPGDAEGFAAVEASRDAFRPAIQHLRDLGHQRIACLAEPPQFAIAAHRLESFMSALNADRCLATEPSVKVAGFHEQDGHRAAMELLTSSERPTAIVALNDLLALGVLQAADELGIRVPDELSVIGFDDIDAARLVTPPLTTIRQSATEVGAALVEELIPVITDQTPSHRQRLIEPELVIRSSTGHARP